MFEKVVKIKWQDKIPDTDVMKKAGMQSVHTVLKLAQLKWTGRVIRMPGEQKRYKYTRKVSLKDFDISMCSWEQTALERSK